MFVIVVKCGYIWIMKNKTITFDMVLTTDIDFIIRLNKEVSKLREKHKGKNLKVSIEHPDQENIVKVSVKEKTKKKYLVKFGNYLLSKERAKTIVNKRNIKEVHDSDLENFKRKP